MFLRRMFPAVPHRANVGMAAAVATGGVMYGGSMVLCDAASRGTGVDATPNSNKTATDHHDTGDPLRDSVLRFFGYTGRAARLLATKAKLSTHVRYLGYSSDVGESMSPILKPHQVRYFYGITWAYVIGDVLYQGKQASEAEGSNNVTVARKMAEVFTFQSIASVALPTLLIHTAVSTTQKALANNSNLTFVRFGPMAAGFALIPLLPFVDEPAEEIIKTAFDLAWPLKAKSETD